MKDNNKYKIICDICSAEFFKGTRKKSKDGKHRCKSCQHKLYNKRHKKVIDTYNKSDRAKRKRKEWRLKKYYNIDLEDFDLLYKTQKGLCAICNKSGGGSIDSIEKESLVVDHCHNTGKIRELLCHKCNRALGVFNDDVSLLRKALNYLEKHNGNKNG